MNTELCSTLFLPFPVRYRFKLFSIYPDIEPFVFTCFIAVKGPSFALEYITRNFPDKSISDFTLYLIAIEEVVEDVLPSKPLLTGSVKVPIEAYINVPTPEPRSDDIEDLPIFSSRLSSDLWLEYYYPELHRFLRCDVDATKSGIKKFIDTVKQLPYDSMLLSSLLDILDVTGNWSDYDLAWFHSTMLRLYGDLHNIKK